VVAIDLCPRYVDTAAIGTPLFTIQVATLCRSCRGEAIEHRAHRAQDASRVQRHQVEREVIADQDATALVWIRSPPANSETVPTQVAYDFLEERL